MQGLIKHAIYELIQCLKLQSYAEMISELIILMNIMEHKSSHKQHRYICSNSQQYIAWVKIINFSFMPKMIRTLRSCSMKIFSKFPTVNISNVFFD